jgi:hypothetical protein
MPASPRSTRRTLRTSRPGSASAVSRTAVSPDLQIDQVPTDSLVPWPCNPRTITAAQLAEFPA